MRAKIIKTDKWIDVEKFKAAYRDKKTLYTYAPEELEFQEIDWDAFRRDAAKDILCAVLAGGIANGAKGFGPQKEELVNASIGVADELIKQLQEDEK